MDAQVQELRKTLVLKQYILILSANLKSHATK